MSTRATSSRIRVAPIHATTQAAVLDLSVAPEQRAFVGDTAFNVREAERDPLSDAMVVLADERVVGFYRLDRAPRTISGRDMGEPTLGLRGIFIDQRLQGRGYGTAAMDACCEDVRRRYPQHQLLVLAAHCCNSAAIAAYLHAGFHDTGERLPGGAAGPQQVMLRRLRAATSQFSPQPLP